MLGRDPRSTERLEVAIVTGRPCKLLGILAHLADGGATEEDLVLTLDSRHGAAWDAVLKTQAQASLTDLNWVFPEANNLPFNRDDVIRLSWDNTDTASFGMEIF